MPEKTHPYNIDYDILKDVPYEYIEYPMKIVNGEIMSCEAIRLACERYLSFFSRDDIYFDYDRADKPVRFISKLKHTEAPFTGQPFELLGWQKFMMHAIFGWFRKDTRLRLVRTVFAQVPRKSGKSTLAAAISLYMLMADGDVGAEVYFVAPSREQSAQCLKYAKNFVDGINKNGILKVTNSVIRFPFTKSMMKTFSPDAKLGDGFNPSCAVCDEVEQYKDSRIPDVLTSGMGMRAQPLLIQILTAGFDLNGYGKDYHDMCMDVLTGMKTDDTLAAFIYELDEGDDWRDTSLWKKCSPSLGETVRLEAMQAEYNKAINMSTQEVNFKTKFLNVWCQSASEWFSYEFILNRMKKVSLDDLAALPRHSYAWLGIDFSKSNDLTGLTLMVHDDIEDKYYFKNWTFYPRDNVKKTKNGYMYEKWANEGYMTLTNGEVIDFDYITKKILEINSKIKIDRIAYDPYGATQWSIEMKNNYGFNMEKFSQKIGNFSGPTKDFEVDMHNDKIIIDYNPAILWMFGNVEFKVDHNGNVKPSKEKENSGKKIDNIISMIEAYGCYVFNKAKPKAGLTIF